MRNSKPTTQELTAKIAELEKKLAKTEWLHEIKNIGNGEPLIPFYGDVTELNTERTILDNVGSEMLKTITSDLMYLLDTSVAVYEKNGDYAIGVFSSGWCQLLDAASRKDCNTDDNKTALHCGKWLCHDDCWAGSKKSIEKKESSVIKCSGGIKLISEPIFTGNEVIGSINIGYGNPPTDDKTLKELAKKYHIDFETLKQKALTYKPRPDFIFEIAKKRLKSIAMLIGEIVSRKQAEENLVKSKTILDEAEFLADVGSFELDIPNNQITVSKGWQKIHGVYKKVLSMKELAPIAHPDDWDRIEKGLDDAFKNRTPYNLVHRIIRQTDHEIRTVKVSGKTIFDEHGKPFKMYGSGIDITEWKEAEHELAKSEEKYKSLFENLDYEVHLWELVKTKNGQIETWKLADVNPKALKSWRKTRNQVIGKTADEIFDYEATKQFMPIIKRIFETGKPYRWEEYFQPTDQYLSMDSIPFGNYFISTGRDVSKEKQMELQLKAKNKELIQAKEKAEESEKKFQRIVNQNPSPLAVMDKNVEQILYWSDSAVKKFGYSPKTIEEWLNAAYPDPVYRKRVLEKWLPLVEKAAESQKATNTGEYEVTCKDGSVIIGVFYVQVLPENIIITFNDITQRKQSELLLQQKSSNLEFLNAMSIPLTDINTADEFSGILIEGLKNHTGASLASFSYYNSERKELQLLHVKAEKGILNTILKVAGKNITKTVTPVDDHAYQMIVEEKVTSKKSFTEVTFGAIPEVIDKAIRASTSIDRLFPIAHVIEGELFGTTMIAFKKGQKSPSIELLKSYAHVLSVSLRRYNAEKELQESKLFADKIANILPAQLFIYDFEKEKNVWTNDVHKRYFKKISDSYLNMDINNIAEIVHKDDFPKVLKKSQEIENQPKNDSFELDIRVKSTNDKWKWMNLRVSAFKRNKDGKLMQSLGTLFDISERKKVEEELIKAKETAEENQIKLIEAQEVSHVGSFEYFAETDNVIWSKELFRIFERSTDLPAPKYSEQELFYTKESFAKLDKAVQDCISKGIPYEIELDIITASGEEKKIISKANAKKDANNRIIGCYGTAQDITKEKNNEIKLQKSYDLLNKLTSMVPGVVYQYRLYPDGHSAFPVSSSGMWDIYEVTPEEVREDASPVFTRIHPDDFNSIVETINESAKNLTLYHQEYRVILPKQGLRWRLCDAKPERLEDGSTLWYGIISDITERKKTEVEILKAKEKAEEADRLKSAFLANMSHEIRTPMNGILGFTNLLEEHDLTGEQRHQFIEIIKKSGNRMLNTVNDIIEISRIETGQIKVSSTEVNISEHLKTLHKFFSLEAEKKGLKLTVNNDLPEEEFWINTDKNKLSSILTNLIKNALKFTEKGNIEIGCKKNSEFIEFYVKDTGIGIPAERQTAIFNRFEQADIEDKQAHEGSGLGLAIVKSYVEMLGGKVWLESEKNKGSTFFFTISCNPVKAKSATKNSTITQVKDNSTGFNILIVEDDDTSSFYLTTILKDKAKNIQIVKDGLEAIEICREKPDFDLILMDLKIPGLDGLKASKIIRENNKRIKIIAQTAHALEGDREKAIEAGCNDYIAKPIDKDKLMVLINKHLEIK